MRIPDEEEEEEDKGELLPEDGEVEIPRPAGRLEQPPPSSQLSMVLACYWLVMFVSLLGWDARIGVEFWASKETVVDKGAWWRLFTALAAHADWEHLLGNGPLFIVFGWLLRSYFGWWFFPILPVLVGVLANLATILWYEPWQRLLGCSGMVYGMVAIWLVLYLRYEVRYTLLVRLFRCLGFSAILLFPSSFHPTTSYLAHFFGFVFGLIAAVGSLGLVRE